MPKFNKKKRQTSYCVKCSDPRKAIFAYGLCRPCYREELGAGVDDGTAPFDRHSPGLRKEHKKMFRALSSVMNGLSDLRVSETDVLAICQTISPYLSPIVKFVVQAKMDAISDTLNGKEL